MNNSAAGDAPGPNQPCQTANPGQNAQQFSPNDGSNGRQKPAAQQQIPQNMPRAGIGNRSVSREPSMIYSSMRQQNSGYYGQSAGGGDSPSSRSGRTPLLNGGGTATLQRRAPESINGDEPRSASQFNPGAAYDTQSVHSRRTISSRVRCGSCSNLTQPIVEQYPDGSGGAVVLYDPRRQSMVQQSEGMPHYLPPPPPFWSPYGAPQFGIPPPPPMYFAPPPPADFETFRKAMKIEKKRLESEKKERSACAEFCCGGVAQLLWTIIAITCLGFLAALILALFVV
ncbi:hypothetical protein DdX_08623 [Ditylenchus destructor]|uniref:Uncharacterized protein n=1 Tax=Ditylenchus destructor TaxID=166010 RepID=A0AAD4N5R8_9BILA|nr:hypothetical protein DdX_08623 [Ditylenchus destructor]